MIGGTAGGGVVVGNCVGGSDTSWITGGAGVF